MSEFWPIAWWDEKHVLTEAELMLTFVAAGGRTGIATWTTTTAGMTDAELGWAECEVRP